MDEPRSPRMDYDEVADRFDARYARDAYEGVEEVVRRFVADATRVLEVGCGTGHWLRVMRAEGRSLAGLDPSREMLAKAAAQAPTAELAQGRAEALPWEAGQFDRVVCINALHHFDDPSAFAREARRVLARGGGLLVVGLDPHTGLDRWWIYDTYPGTLERDRARYPSAQTLQGWLTAAGFRALETCVAQHFPARTTVRDALRLGYLERTSTSQLTLLTEDEHRRGRDSLVRDPDAILETDLRLWATIGWVDSA